MARLTVAICTYNRAKYLGASINSVIAQSYKDIKIVVYDNMSTDDTETIVRQAMTSDSRIEYIRHDPNIGAVRNFNYAMDNCDTEYLIIFHDDDIMLPNMLEVELGVMDAYKDAILCGQSMDLTTIDEHGDILKSARFTQSIKCYEQKELIDYNIKCCASTLVCPTVMFRTALINKFRLRFLLDRGIACDWILWMNANQYGQAIVIAQDLIRYRIHLESDSQSSSAERWMDAHWHVEKWLEENGFKDKLSGFRKYFRTMGINRCIETYCENFGKELYSAKEFKDCLAEYYNKYGWEAANNKKVVTRYLNIGAGLVGEHKMSLLNYLSIRRNIKKEFGTPPSLYKEINWFFKYYLKRCFR